MAKNPFIHVPKRVDANQKGIIKRLRSFGASVQDIHEVGQGCPDIMVGFRGINFLFEVKTEGEDLNEREKEWNDEWKGTSYKIYNSDEAIIILIRETTRR